MSDQVAEQSPQSRLEAMLGDDIQSDVPVLDTPEEERKPQEAEAETEVPTDEVETEEEAVDDAPDDQAEEEEQSQDEVPAILKLKVNKKNSQDRIRTCMRPRIGTF